MTGTARPRRPAGAPRSSGAAAVVLALTGGLALGLPAAAAAGPQLRLDPPSGGPGTAVTVTGTGFCGDPGCGPVQLLLAGQRVGPPVPADAAGRVTTRFQAPGGHVPGDLQVSLEQTGVDGSLLLASQPFGYSPSRGEEAERKAEERDALDRLLDPSLPEPSPRGVPLTSAVPVPGAGDGATPTAGGPEGAGPAAASGAAAAGPDPAEDGAGRGLALGAGLAALAAVVTAALWWRGRRSASGPEGATGGSEQ